MKSTNMGRTAAATAVLALVAAWPSVASAESSVTLSGLLGSGVTYTSNAAPGTRAQLSGTHAVPFWAISGREDLGDGNTAFFRFSQYSFLDTGITAPFESYVGLSSARWGTVTLGSMYDLLADLVPFTSERYTSLLATHPGNLDRTVGNSLSNTVKYKSPVTSGFGFGLEYGFGEPGTASNTGRVLGGELNYTAGPWQAVLVWESVHGIPFAPVAKLGITRLYGLDFSKAPATTLSQDQDTATLGLAYADQGWRLMANYSDTRLAAAGASQDEKARSLDLGAYKYISTQLRVGGGYSYTTLASYHWNQWHAHADYALSRRTSLYVLGVLQLAGAGQLAVMRNQPVATASRQAVFEVGMTHLF
ncbi:porin [Pelomonas sp. KK5]|uniref:porin n=1 Tax=Pelomonas sp. KK5 TaxID=1855730 RepID=UPI001E637CFD|nr:porin [Pelomonas sp. KK5]